MRSAQHLATGLALGLALLTSVSAQNYPQRPIQVVVPVSAGGGTDVMARTVGQKVG